VSYTGSRQVQKITNKNSFLKIPLHFPQFKKKLLSDQKLYTSALHPMYCTDIVWASVVDQTKLHIRDGYSRDKGTPLTDEEFPGGKNSITAAFGLETIERTVVMFRRAIISEFFGNEKLY
jgi:hypothetical protein